MAVNKVSTPNNAHTHNATNNAKGNKKAQEKPAEEKSGVNSPASTFRRSNEPYDKAEVERLLRESRDQTRMFEQLISSALNTQGKTFAKAWNSMVKLSNLKSIFENINVDEETRAKAQELVSEDGYWGVKQTSERLLSFAKAYAGDDPDRIEKMRNAFLKGFEAAEKAWGGRLPDISYATRDAVLKGFDEMAQSAGASGSVE